jgi:hypothetical protein
MEAIKNEIVSKQMKACTFKPQIYKVKKPSFMKTFSRKRSADDVGDYAKDYLLTERHYQTERTTESIEAKNDLH